MKSYQKEGSQKAQTHGEYFKNKMRNSILDTGHYKSAMVDTEMKKIDPEADIPEALKLAYFKMVKAGIKSRIQNDNDYRQIQAQRPDQYEFLG